MMVMMMIMNVYHDDCGVPIVIISYFSIYSEILILIYRDDDDGRVELMMVEMTMMIEKMMMMVQMIEDDSVFYSIVMIG